MHPFIKILSLLVTISMLVALNPQRVITITVILFLFLIFKGRSYWRDIGRMSWRMKWLWLSLLVLYGWFIPGSPIFFPEIISLAFIPSTEGLTMGLLRALVLLNIISAVVLIIKSTSKEALIVSIMWLMTPLKLFKINTGIFAARLVLTMESVTETETRIKQSLMGNNDRKSIFQRGIDAIAYLLVNVEQQARNSQDTLVSLPHIDKPKLIEWLIPIMLFVVMYLI